MKKTFLTLLATFALTITMNAQCDQQSTLLITECGNYCVSVIVPLTGDLSTDVAIAESTNYTGRRKPTVTELMAVADELC